MSYNPNSSGPNLKLNGSTSGVLSEKANATTTSYTVTWPAAVAAASGYALVSDTSGNLSWSPAGISSITGDITTSGSGGSVTATLTAVTNSTITTLSSLSLPGSQVTGNISGTASNITATTNSTLTSLPSLTLLGSQVSGNISGTASNITATTNSTLTTLSALSLPASQVTGLNSLYATTTLNNLGTTAINADLLPGTASTLNLGNATVPFSTAAINTLNLYYPAQTSIYGSLSINSVDFAQVILQAVVPQTEIQLQTANHTGGNTGDIKAATGNATGISGGFVFSGGSAGTNSANVSFTTGNAGQISGGMIFTTGFAGPNYNSGGFTFTAGNVSGTGVQGSFNVDAGAVNINNTVMIDSNGAASFVTPNNTGHLFNGPSEPILISTGSEITNGSGNVTVSTGGVSSVFLFFETSFSGTLVAGDVYSVGGVNYTFIQSIFGEFYFSSSAAGVPPANGTLTKVSSAGGPATIPYINASQNVVSSGNLYLTTGASNPYANTGNVVIGAGTPGTGGVQGNVLISGPKLDLTGTNVIQLASTVTPSGTDGAQTINKASGTVNFAPAATSLVVTNSLVTTNSLVFATIRTNDATAQIKNVVPAAGSFTINLSAAATAETSVGFLVINQ